MEIKELAGSLRKALTEYRYIRKNEVISIHINAIDIALCLVEYAIENRRPIGLDERRWFEAAYYVSYILDGSDWEELSTLYAKLVGKVKEENYFN